MPHDTPHTEPERRAMCLDDPTGPFLADISMFYADMPITFLGTGAEDEQTFVALAGSELKMHQVLLVEPDPAKYASLVAQVDAAGHSERATCINHALSEAAGAITASKSISRTTDEEETGEGSGDTHEIPSTRVDDLTDNFPDGRVSILDVGARASGQNVLGGAVETLAAGKIDVVSLAVSFDRSTRNTIPLATADETLRQHGYQLFKLYEQTQDWVQNRPTLSRARAVFLSPSMQQRYPLSLLQKHHQLRSEASAAKSALAEQSAAHEREMQARYAEIATLTEMLAERGRAPNDTPRPPVHLGAYKPRKGPVKVGPFSLKRRQFQALVFFVAWLIAIWAIYIIVEGR